MHFFSLVWKQHEEGGQVVSTKTTIKVGVIISSGTTQQTIDYVIEDVVSWGSSSYTGGAYYIITEEEEYRFPIDRTILKIKRNEQPDKLV